jgi:hypothetical protein
MFTLPTLQCDSPLAKDIEAMYDYETIIALKEKIESEGKGIFTQQQT